MLRLIFSIALSYTITNSFSQDSLYTRSVISKLTSESFHGRGYVKSGDKKTARYIAKEFKRLSLEPITDNYFQEFKFPVNTFPSKMQVSVDGKKLVPGQDYIVHPASLGVKESFKIFTVDQPPSFYKSEQVHNRIVLVQKPDSLSVEQSQLYNEWEGNSLNEKGVIIAEPVKLTWSVSTKAFTSPALKILNSSLPDQPGEIRINIRNKLINHTARNVIAQIKSKELPDSFIVITAHLDHLGRMGRKTYFPGANDNASGISMLLNLATYYSQKVNVTKYSLLFIAFAGEEAGLIGSKFFTEHPLVPLEKIKFLINLDLLGTGDDGLMVVNGEIHPERFNVIDSLNKVYNYLPKIGKRGKARNSDHYYFSEKGVPAFFLYTIGGIKAYHDVYDKASTLPLTKYKEVFKLLTGFINTF